MDKDKQLEEYIEKYSWLWEDCTPLRTAKQRVRQMPIHKVPGGWKWGKTGKVYKNKEDAEKQMRAIYASGYKEEEEFPSFREFVESHK